jgi:phage-related protein
VAFPDLDEKALLDKYSKKAMCRFMQWRVSVLDDRVRMELDALPSDMRARLARIVDLIEAHGLEHVHEPHVKHLHQSLWEMRMKGRDDISRAIYVTASGRRVIIVRAFVKKAQKTPHREIKLALQRAEELK